MSTKEKIYRKIKCGVKKLWKRVLRYSGYEVSYIYDEEFANKPWRNKGYTEDFKNIVTSFYNPDSVVDVGCGTGDFLLPFFNEGVDVLGIDGSKYCFQNRKIPGDKFLVKDIRFDEIDYKKFDVCLCMEVAEHIEEKFSNRLIDVITKLSSVVIFTAATPGQGGVDHVNEKPREWWVNKFEKRNYIYQQNETDKFSDLLSNIDHSEEHDKKSIKNYEENIMIFKER